MLAEIQVLKPGIRIARSHTLALRRRTIQIMKAMAPTCDRGGCKNHAGRCSMDDAWEVASAEAADELSSPEEIA
jgi:hypothetical protein